MGIFSFFSKPDKDVKGSYCETESSTHVDHHKGDKVEDEYFSSRERGDETIIQGDFDNEVVNVRCDDSGQQAKHGARPR